VVIACEHCNTRFQLDDARVPETGVRVRCSRCKHSFFVAPAGGDDEALHAVAAEAAVSAAPSLPTPTEDLPPPPAEAGVPPESPSRSGGDVEEDWQFNLPGDQELVEQSAAGFAASASSGLAAPSEPAAGQGGEPTPSPNAPLPNSAFESSAGAASNGFSDDESGSLGLGDSASDGTQDGSDLRDQLFGDDEESPIPEDSPSAAESEPEQEQEPDAGGGEEQFFGHSDQHLGDDPDDRETAEEEVARVEVARGETARGETAPGQAAAPEESALDDLGSPEEWDFLGDTPRPVEAPSTSIGQMTASEQEAAEPEPAAVYRAPQEAPRWAPWLDAAGWLACGVLLLAGVIGAWGASPGAAFRSAPAAEIGSLRVQDLRAVVVENVHAGPVWVFRGTLVNPGDEAARAEVVPQLTLLDTDGEVVGKAWFGRSPTGEALRERKPTEVAPLGRAASSEWSRRSLAAGDSIELTAVVERMPAGAVSWQVDAVAAAR